MNTNITTAQSDTTLPRGGQDTLWGNGAVNKRRCNGDLRPQGQMPAEELLSGQNEPQSAPLLDTFPQGQEPAISAFAFPSSFDRDDHAVPVSNPTPTDSPCYQGTNREAGAEAEMDHHCHRPGSLEDYALAMVYAPKQHFAWVYDPMTALMRGTMFRQLDMPWEGSRSTGKGGKCCGRNN